LATKKKAKAADLQGLSERDAKIALLKSKYPNITKLRKPIKPVPVEDCLPTPSISLNLITNEGGLRPGACVEYYGLEGTMKTWMALEMCRESQQKYPDLSVAYFDPEHAVDKYIAQSKIGVDMGYLPGGFPKFDYFPEDDEVEPTLEDYLNRIYDYAASGLYSLIVLDSVAASMSLWESEQTDITNAKWGGPSIPMSKAMKRIKAVAAKTGTRIWYVNQLRTTTVSTPSGNIAKDEPGGGKAIRYAATHRYKVGWAKKDADYAMLRFTAEKNKYGPPWQTVEVPVVMGQGIDKEADLIQTAERFGLIRKSGNWFYTLDGEAIGNGLRQAAENLRKKPEEYTALYAAVLDKGLPKEDLDTPLIDQPEPHEEDDAGLPGQE
jgi:recombination protein RecA